MLRGRSINGMIAACAYHVSKQEGIPITFQEILDETSVEESIVKKCYKIMVKKFNLTTPLTDPITLLPRYCAELDLNMEIENTTTRVLQSYIKKNSICGKDPKGITAGGIYLVAKLKNQKISQKEIAQVTGVTEVTLRSRYKEIMKQISFAF